VLGRRSGLADRTLRHITRAEKLTSRNTGLHLNIGFNYGGRAELVDACKSLCRLAARGELDPEEISESLLAAHLATADFPDPDLLIRTRGEFRVSNFLLWQIAYSELYVTNVLWPDFRDEHLRRAISDFQSRQRRFGKV
jgi:undecaprenyl diphosphate synthase